MGFVREAVNVFAAVFGAVFAQFIIEAFRHQQAAYELHALVLYLLLLSPTFWGIVVALFVLLHFAGRLPRQSLRVLLFWIPSALVSALGLGVCILYAYLWLQLRRS